MWWRCLTLATDEIDESGKRTIPWMKYLVITFGVGPNSFMVFQVGRTKYNAGTDQGFLGEEPEWDQFINTATKWHRDGCKSPSGTSGSLPKITTSILYKQ